MSTSTHDRYASDATQRAAAEDRLFEMALAEVLTGDPSRAPLASPRAPAPQRAWLTAATMLLAVAVALSVWWLRTGHGQDEAGQDPQALPTTARIDGGEALRALPAATTRLAFNESIPADLQALARLRGLRWLTMNAQFAGGNERLWHTAAPAMLEPLTSLPQLESLGLPFPMQLTPQRLAVLAGCPQLRSLHIAGAVMQLDEATVAALSKWPALRHLAFASTPLSAEEITRLASLPRLDALEFSSSPGFGRDEFLAVSRLPHLRELGLSGLGETSQPLPGQKGSTFWAPTAADLRELRQTRLLRKLSLHGTNFSPDGIDALPDDLESLSLSATDTLLPEVFVRLRRLTAVRDLSIGTPGDLDHQQHERIDAAAADLIAALPLEHFEWSGDLGPKLAGALAAAPSIRELSLTWSAETNLQRLTRMPRLAALTLHSRWSKADQPAAGPLAQATPLVPTIGQCAPALRALREIRSLRRVMLHARDWPDSLIAELREALGRGITLELR